MKIATDRMELAKRIAKHEAPIQVPVNPEAAKRELVKISARRLLNAVENKPPADIEVLSAAEMFFAYRWEISSFGLFAKSKKFQQIVDAFGSQAEKKRLEKLAVGYQCKPTYRKPTPGKLTLSLRDYNFLAACGVTITGLFIC